MILWCDGDHSPAENMTRDEILLESAARAGPESDAVLRLFRFRPWGITVGRSQRPERELDLERCRADDVPWAVRPTGGRAIFHAQEWTYSLSAPLSHPVWGGSASRVYERVSRLVLTSLVELGIPAALADRVPGRRGAGRAAKAACFAATARHEILLDGGKLVGTAQRRAARALLVQGSVLLGPAHLRLIDYLLIPDSRKLEARESLRVRAADAARHLDPETPLERWADSIGAELPGRIRRFDGASGGFLLTLPEAPSYTPPIP